MYVCIDYIEKRERSIYMCYIRTYTYNRILLLRLEEFLVFPQTQILRLSKHLPVFL